MVVYGEFLILLTIFCINPFLGFIISLYKAISTKKNIKYLFLISIYYGFFGLIYLSQKSYDIRVHYELFLQIKNLSLELFWNFLLNQKDWLVLIIYKILGFFIENPRWIGFISAMFSYGVPIYIIINFGQMKKMKKYEKIVFIILFLGITPSSNFSGMRNFNAICLFSLGVYSVDILKLKRGYIYMALSPLLHIFVLPLILLYLLSKSFKITKLKMIFSFIFSLIFLKFSRKLLYISLEIFPKYRKYLSPYIEGAHASDVTISWIPIAIYCIFFFGVSVLFYIYNFSSKKLDKLYFANFFIICFSFVSMFSFSKTMYIRYISASELILIIILMQIYTKAYYLKNILLVVIFSFSFSSYLAFARIEYQTWNFKLVGCSIFGILREGEYLNNDRDIKLVRE